MTPAEARDYISGLTYDQKLALRALLEDLEQKRPPVSSHPATDHKAAG